MKKILSLIALCISVSAFSQTGYWQQKTDYTIKVKLNEQQNTLSGFLSLNYTNNSPDALNQIPFHLWQNATRNEKTAFVKQIMNDKDGKQRWKKIKEKGGVDSIAFTVNGAKAEFTPHPEHIDIIYLKLPQALKPGETIKIETPFFVKIPTYSSRSGREDNTYMMCQWYPKPAVYDAKGWHAMPYLDMGEFYSEFGSFDVSITVPTSFVVGATGVLQTSSEVDTYKTLGKFNAAQKEMASLKGYKTAAAGTKTLQYKADNVPDFAWFADPDFIVRYDTMSINGGPSIDVFSFAHPDGSELWKNSLSYIKSGTRAYSSYLGDYPYPTVQAVEGPKNVMSGGMEYPMITLITSPDANELRLDAVITHEVGHNWFCIMLGSNERLYTWMDEGINSYYQMRYEAEKYKGNSLFGDALPAELKTRSVDDFQAIIYQALSESLPMEEAINIPAANFKDKDEYGIVSYFKTAIWMYLMELQIGRDKLDKAMRVYFTKYKFKHPQPEDLKRVLQEETGVNMDPFFQLLNKKGKL